MLEKLKSRKLWVAVTGAALTAFGQQLGLNPHDVNQAVHLLMAYLGGQSLHDVAAAMSSKQPAPAGE